MLSIPISGPLLAIEASTAAGSVALWVSGALVGVERVAMGVGREDQLFPAIQRLLASAQMSPRELRAIVCGEGPGSFTSLRIAGSLAKGLAHGAALPLYAVSSLLLAAASADASVPAGRYIVHADALRGERYVLSVIRSAEGTTEAVGPLARMSMEALALEVPPESRLAVLASPMPEEERIVVPSVDALARLAPIWAAVPVSLEQWEPVYGRLAEAQVKWEETNGIALPAPTLAST